jgi:succinate dehydrogenase/fumarate reductase flavoprotein subunit
MKLKFATLRGWKSSNVVRPTKPHKNAANELQRAKENVAAIFGPSIERKQASQLLKLAEFRAMRAIAKALASSPVMRRVEGRRRARNFIREELGLYRRPNSTVRPSNVKARRIVS